MQTVRQEGIFYHALKPAGRDDTEEILTAVECAFKKTEKNERKQMERPAMQQEAAPVAAMPCAAAQMTEEVSEELPEEIKPGTTRESWQRVKKMRVKVAAILSALTVAGAGVVYCVAVATKGMKESSDMMIWAFLGFCALIAVGQLLPAFFSVRAARKEVEQQLQEGLAVNGEKEPAFAAVDKN
jgi:hypothetical protein